MKVEEPSPEPEPEPEEAPAGEKAEEPEVEASAGGVDWDSVRDRVVAIVSEKTGYPEDMLDLDLD
ncbi:hypothetical protein B6U90_02325, partial [Thermoplasmatales archaeon ex4484_6]